MTHTDTQQRQTNRRSHPFYPPNKDLPHASSSQASCKYNRTFYRQTQRNQKQEIQTKMTDRQNTYNFSHKRPKQPRSKHSETKHEDQPNKPKSRPKFKQQHIPPHSLQDASRTFPKTPIQNNEIKKGTRGWILNQTANHSRFLPKPIKTIFLPINRYTTRRVKL
jgi:hypothetical protein